MQRSLHLPNTLTGTAEWRKTSARILECSAIADLAKGVIHVQRRQRLIHG